MVRAIFAVLALAVVVTACQPPAPTGFTAEDRAAVEAIAPAYTEAFLAEDWAAIGAFYAPDARSLPPGAEGSSRRPLISFPAPGRPKADRARRETAPEPPDPCRRA